MNTEYRYRNGTAEDQEKLQKLGMNAFGQFKEVLTEENWNKLSTILNSETTYSELLEKSKCFVCEINDEIVGMAYLIPKGNPTDIFSKDWCYLRMVGVHSAHEGRGIAKQLMQICLDYAKQTDEKVIALHTSEFMNAARHIYENMGFVQVKELETRLGKKYWLYTRHL